MNNKYPWDKLQVMESFIVRGIDYRRAASIGACGRKKQLRTGKRFMRRKIDGGYEFKRVA